MGGVAVQAAAPPESLVVASPVTGRSVVVNRASCPLFNNNRFPSQLRLISPLSVPTAVVCSPVVVVSNWITVLLLLGTAPKMELHTGKSRTAGVALGVMLGTSKLVARAMFAV